MRTVTVQDLVDTLQIDIVHGAEYSGNLITSSEVSRPGLIMTGYTTFHPQERVQLLGMTEISYLEMKSPAERQQICEYICVEATPAIVISRGLEIPEELVGLSVRYGVPLLSAKYRTSRVLANITNYLEGELADRISVHGVLVEIFGMGVLIQGESGIGKSEIALELIQRGHRLVADDRVDLFMLDELTLKGEAPEILQNMLEVRGLGIIDVLSLYGVAAIRHQKVVELIIELVEDGGTEHFDRFGIDPEVEMIDSVKLPKYRIPVRPGRNLSSIIEVAAMNFRATNMGYDARETFTKKLTALIESNREALPDE